MVGFLRRSSGARAFFALLAFLATAPAQAAVFHPQSFLLANGMQVVVVPGAFAPAVSQMVWYKTGAADDPAGKSGLAHYLEHLMFKATAAYPAGAFSATIAAQGGNDNAFTDYDSTAFYVSIAADRLPLAMALEAERMRHLRLTPEEAKPELDVVLSERQQRTDNNPQAAFDEKLEAALFPGQPYGRPVIGWRNEIEKLTAQDARTQYETHYAPNNAVLVVSGAVDPQKVVALADATFGRLPPAAGPRRVSLPKPDRVATARVEMKDARVKQAYALRRIVAPSYITGGCKAAALEVLAEALAGGEVGILYRHFVMERRLASGIDVSYDPVARGPATFSLAMTAVPGGNLRGLEAEVEAYLKRLARRGLPPAAVRAAQQRLEDSAIFARDRLMAPAQVLGESLAIGQKVADVEAWPERIRAVTPQEVNAALRALLAEPAQVSGILESS